ncbi:Mediator of RNA polymerase 2 transcription subunit 26 [Danaus plexippus plexippus]|uniref:Mediator of RNA polymerase II transcription subunit 26 n=1 Tax=Danaus plexippus plexippus TaxID=278856 RepID=A0A212FHB3_DANPL|nr:Mediator of RNA polymerase 2 transcription subunit 26 [Danaus plexippus plexippus]
MSNNAHELSNRLLNALDSNYNVVDMQTVNEIISILEKFNITKELLETTRLGKHVNELRRKTSEPTLARRAKVLVKRWRDLVIPSTHSPAHTGSNRSSAERQVRRLGGTPLTSPALSRNLVSPAVPSPRPPSRPAWGGYESDSQDVILVDDDPPPPVTPSLAPLPPHKPATPPVKRALSPEPLYDEKKAKRDKKPKKRRGHGRAGSGTETTAEPQSQHNWVSRNGTGPERRRNGWKRDPPDPYAALVNRLPPAGAKKVKTTKELLEQIQSRGSSRPSRPASPRSPHSPASPASPDVMLIEPDVCPIKVESPLRNGGGDSAKTKMDPEPEEREEVPPLEEPRAWAECTCGEEEASADCPAAGRPALRPLHVRALHNVLLPGMNGTRAPLFPHRFAVRPPARDDDPTLFSSVVPLYNYSDYADDHCVKNMSRVPICERLPWTEFAPSPPPPSPPPSPPPLRPYPSPLREEVFPDLPEPDDDSADSSTTPNVIEATSEDEPREKPVIEPAMVGLAYMEPGERLKAPLLDDDDDYQLGEPRREVTVEKSFVSEPQEHRTVERTKEDIDGRTLYGLCEAALASVPYRYSQAAAAPVLTLPQLIERENEPPDHVAEDEAAKLLEGALETAAADPALDELGRPQRPLSFAEWHECARLGDLVALPYVVID